MPSEKIHSDRTSLGPRMNDESGATDSSSTRSPMIALHARAATPQQLRLLRSTRAELEAGMTNRLNWVNGGTRRLALRLTGDSF